MSAIQLFSTNGAVVEMKSKTAALEKDLQRLIEENMLTMFGVTFLQTEYVIANGRMDSIGIDENNCPVIFEYKRSINENVINQGLFYLDWLMDHKANFKLLVMEKLGSQKAEQIDWSMPCVICVANDFTKYDLHAVNQMQRNIRLIKYKWYDGLLLFEHLNAPVFKATGETVSAQVEANGEISPKSEPSKAAKKPNKTFTDYFAQAGKARQELYATVRDYLLTLENVTENPLKYYVAFKNDKSRNIVCAEVYQSCVCLHLPLNPDTVELKDDFIIDDRKKGHWGTGHLGIRLQSEADFEEILPLIDRAYKES